MREGVRAKAILLVEDDPDDELLALRALGANDLVAEVVVARDGAEALERLFRGDALPDLVLLDLKLPKVDGLEVLRRLRADERTRRLPVVVLSSSTERRDVVACYGLGANSYVRKPVDFARFVRVVEQLESYWLALNEAPPDGTEETGP